jgi:hypothetical protein
MKELREFASRHQRFVFPFGSPSNNSPQRQQSNPFFRDFLLPSTEQLPYTPPSQPREASAAEVYSPCKREKRRMSESFFAEPNRNAMNCWVPLKQETNGDPFYCAHTHDSIGFAVEQSQDIDAVPSPVIKRRRLEIVTPTHMDSLSMRLANWLLPSEDMTTDTDTTTDTTTQEQQQETLPTSRVRAPTRMLKKRKSKSASSLLARLDQWLFQDTSAASDAPTAEKLHQEMRTEN